MKKILIILTILIASISNAFSKDIYLGRTTSNDGDVYLTEVSSLDVPNLYTVQVCIVCDDGTGSRIECVINRTNAKCWIINQLIVDSYDNVQVVVDNSAEEVALYIVNDIQYKYCKPNTPMGKVIIYLRRLR